MPGNNVRKIREALMMSKAELARKAGLSTLTIDRVEAGKACRLDTKRKILHALGLKVADREQVFNVEAAEPAGSDTDPMAESQAMAESQGVYTPWDSWDS